MQRIGLAKVFERRGGVWVSRRMKASGSIAGTNTRFTIAARVTCVGEAVEAVDVWGFS
jgi:hypothetical protein